MRNPRPAQRFALFGTTLGASALLALFAMRVGAASAGSWAIEGVMSDACQCRVFCPCELAQKPTFGHCNDTAIIHIERGHYGRVSLDGQRVVVVAKSPDGERMVDTVGELDFAHFYVPDTASEAQADALAALARQIFGAWVDHTVARVSADETVQRVPMEVQIEVHRHRVEIPDVLSLDVEALIGHDGETPVALRNGPAAGPGHGDIVVARSHEYRYTDHGIDWDYPGRSASIRRLSLSGEIAGSEGDEP